MGPFMRNLYLSYPGMTSAFLAFITIIYLLYRFINLPYVFAQFAEWLQLSRKQCGLTQEQLAELVKVEPRTVQRWEAGESAPTTAHMRAVRSVLAIPQTRPPLRIKPDPKWYAERQMERRQAKQR